MTLSKNKTKLNELDERYVTALKKHVELYPQYKVFNDSPSIGKRFDENKNVLANIQSELFSFKNNI